MPTHFSFSVLLMKSSAQNQAVSQYTQAVNTDSRNEPILQLSPFIVFRKCVNLAVARCSETRDNVSFEYFEVGD